MPYQVVTPGSLKEAAAGRSHARSTGRCLVLLPPLTAEESAVLLAQLPSAPPPAAALAVFTSGSEGHPKGVFHTEDSLQASARQVARWLGSEPGILSTLAPWSMAGFLFGVILQEIADLQVHTLTDNPLFAGGEATALIKQGSVTKVITHPYHLRIFLERGFWLDVCAGRELAVASFTAPLPRVLRERAEALGIKVEIGYGLSEAAGPVLVDGGSLGAQCALSSTHELFLSGAQMMLGYAQNGVFTPMSAPFATGDIFTATAGRLEWSHRVRELIDVAGRKIAPALVEEIVSGYLGNGDCLAYSVADEIYGQRVALLVEKPDLNAEEFQRFLDQVFSPELRPREWSLVEKLPRLPSGKKKRTMQR